MLEVLLLVVLIWVILLGLGCIASFLRGFFGAFFKDMRRTELENSCLKIRAALSILDREALVDVKGKLVACGQSRAINNILTVRMIDMMLSGKPITLSVIRTMIKKQRQMEDEGTAFTEITGTRR